MCQIVQLHVFTRRTRLKKDCFQTTIFYTSILKTKGFGSAALSISMTTRGGSSEADGITTIKNHGRITHLLCLNINLKNAF